MVVAWHDAAFTLPDPVLTPDLMHKILAKFHIQHKLKQTWTKEEELLYSKMLNLDEDMMTGTAKVEEKDEEMLKRQNELQDEISEGRLKIKEMRDH